jgi:hypothetical protein
MNKGRSSPVSDQEWEQLFGLINKASGLPGMSANDKEALIKAKVALVKAWAKELVSRGNRERLLAMLEVSDWFSGIDH